MSRRLPEALGLNIRDILAAAADKHEGIFYLSIMGCTDSTFNYHRLITRVLEGVYHTEYGADGVYLETDDG